VSGCDAQYASWVLALACMPRALADASVVRCGVTGAARASHAVTARGRDKLLRCACVRLRLGSERLWDTPTLALCL
jgi:hypothetical protein